MNGTPKKLKRSRTHRPRASSSKTTQSRDNTSPLSQRVCKPQENDQPTLGNAEAAAVDVLAGWAGDPLAIKREDAGQSEKIELEVNSRQTEHLRRRLNNLPTPEAVRETAIGETTATLVPRVVAAEIAGEEVGPSCSFQPQTSESAWPSDELPLIITIATDLADQEDVNIDPEPTTYGLARPSSFEDDDSEIDSDHGDEWDRPMSPYHLVKLEVPDDDDMNESPGRGISALESAMDEDQDRLLDMNIDFKWESSYDTFSGVQETFTGPTPGPINDYATPYDAFVDIWDENIMDHISFETNRYAGQTIDEKTENETLAPQSRLRRWDETTVSELYVLFGIFILMGIDTRASVKEYWCTNKFLEMPGFKNVITYARYILLIKFLHFFDNSTLQAFQQSGDSSSDHQIQKLQPIIDWLNEKFISLYNLLPDICIEESLLLVKGHLSGTQAIQNKAFGIKSYELCEALTGYLYKFNICTGRVNSPNTDADTLANAHELGGSTTKMVLKLMDGLWNRGHCLTMDNIYNSPALARHLKLRGTDCLGTLRPNRRHVPDSVRMASDARRGALVSRHSGDVSIITWKDAKPVTLISTFHDDSTVMVKRRGRPSLKPTVLRDYDLRMKGVDLKDQKLSYFRTERTRSLKWYIKMFKRLFNASVHNAWLMFNSSRRRKNLPIMKQREFRYELAEALIGKHQTGPNTVSPCIASDMRTNRQVIHIPFKAKNLRRRCVYCYRIGIRKEVATKCETCGVFLCFDPCWEPYHTLQELPKRR